MQERQERVLHLPRYSGSLKHPDTTQRPSEGIFEGGRLNREPSTMSRPIWAYRKMAVFRTISIIEGTLSDKHTFPDTLGLGRKPGFSGVRKTQKTDFLTHCQAMPKTILDTLGSCSA